MSRLPFNPAKMAAARTAEREEKRVATESVPPLTISQLAARIDSSLKAGFPESIRFIGEVSGFRDRTHWYFDLKDAGAVVNCVMFQSAARKAGFTPTNGQQLIARGRVEFYAAGGKVSILLDKIEPVGAGVLELAYRALCEELRVLGWFAQERKRPLPTFPKRIAIVTSRTGAALQDVLVTMKNRCPAVGVLIVDCRVQGASAAPEVAAAVKYLSANAAKLGIDAILVTRGGGSMEDLWAFNERIVAEAIIQCTIPVVAAIGHETDTTIAELVADERCATPTQAAMRLTPDAAALLRQVEANRTRLAALIQRVMVTDRRRLASAATRPIFTIPRAALAAPNSHLSHLWQRLTHASSKSYLTNHSKLDRLATRLERCRPAAQHALRTARLLTATARLHAATKSLLNPTRLNTLAQRLRVAVGHSLRANAASIEALERQLAAVGPMQVLERGYSYTVSASGSLIRTPDDVKGGDRIETRLSKGTINSIVGTHSNSGTIAATPLPSPPRKSKRRPPPDAGNPGLFGK